MPVAFYPNYDRLGAELGRYPYKLRYAVIINTVEGINLISAPEGAEVKFNSDGKHASIFND